MTNFEHCMSKEELAKARNQFSAQKNSCRTKDKRDVAGLPVEVRMSFEDWLHIWIESGKYHLRGNRKGCYVMGRKDDHGHYELGNVEIIPHAENVSFAHKGEKNINFGKTGSQNHMFGKTVEHGSFKGTTVATILATGEQIFMDGGKAIVAAGFDPGAVSKCINGKRKQHLGHRFHRITQ